MYADIASNKRKSVVLISLFAAIVIALGWGFGLYAGNGRAGIVIAALVATVMTLVGYYKGDAVPPAPSGARRVEKRDAPELCVLVENLSIAAGLPTPATYVIDDPSPNAFATGRDPRHASVAVTTGMLAMLEKQELEGVLAHELSHIGNYDIRVMTLVVVLVGVILLLSDWMTRFFFFGRGSRDNDNN